MNCYSRAWTTRSSRLIAGAVVTAALSLSLSAPSQAASKSHHKRTHKNAHQIRQDLHAVRARIQEKRRQIHASKKHEHRVTAQMVEVEHRLLQTEARLRRSRTRLEDLIEQQKVLATRIAATDQRLQSRRRLLASRIRANYERGNTGYMTVMLGSRSLHDYMSRSYYVGRIVDSDVKLLEEIKALLQQVREDKRKKDEQAAEVKRLTASLADDQASFSDDYHEKQDLLHEIRDKRGAMVEALEAMEQASNDLAAELRALQQTPRGRARQLQRWTGTFIKPASGPITSGFGSRYHPILHRQRMHTGVDIGACYGAPIHAAAGGEVIMAGYRNGYGNCVVIDHGGGVTTLYGHCSSLSVSVGQQVQQGQVIAHVGATGLATGPHLHFEVRHNGSPVNPL